MPIQFNLQSLKDEHDCKIYLETGLFDPTCDISCKKALSVDFDRVYSIEIRNEFVESGKQIFKEYIDSSRLTLINDDSVNLINHLNNDDFNKRTMFFLDAHVDNENIKNFKRRCPLFEELNAIANLPRKDHVICIDDIRYLKEPFPWSEFSFGPIIFLDFIQQMILSINNNYKFKYLNGQIENDVLVAYIE